MMKYEYTRTAAHSYMIVRNADFEYDGYQLQMLAHNRIPGLLEMKVIMENGKAEYWYDITGLQPVAGKGAGEKVTWDKLCMMIRNICDIKITLENYLLDADSLVYEEKYMFRDRKAEKIRFCYVPGLKEQQTNGLLVMMEQLLERLDHSDPRVVRAGYEIYERCASGEAGVEGLLQCISQEQLNPLTGIRSVSQTPYSMMPDTPEPMQVREERVYPAPEETHRGKAGFLSRKKRRKEADADEWTEDDFVEMKEIGRWDKTPVHHIRPEEEDRPTELFSQKAVEGGLWLLYRGQGKEHDLRPGRFPFLIGKKEGDADGILHAKTVSRVHARIYREGDGYYLEDENSTNGTYLNGELLPCHTPYPLRSGDRILFGDEAFQAALLP